MYRVLALALTASATPVARDVSDTSFDMDNIVTGSTACASTAVVFARGTFDSGNIGVWVGPAFENALRSKISSLAFQGVDEDEYPANLDQYLDENGSNSCAEGLARIVDEYALKCPQAKIVVSGWRYAGFSHALHLSTKLMLPQSRSPLRTQSPGRHRCPGPQTGQRPRNFWRPKLHHG